MFNRQYLSFFTLLAIAISAVENKSLSNQKLPDYINVCHRHDPGLNTCVRQTLNSLRKHLDVGIPELFVPAMEPLTIPELRLDQQGNAIYMKSLYKNVQLQGLRNFTIKHVNVDVPKMLYNMTINVPVLHMKADYEMDGKIMMLPLVGEGACNANFTNVNVNVVMKTQLHKKYGHTHLKLKALDLKYKVQDAAVYFENLFNGDEKLGKQMNEFLNENWQVLEEELQPLMENAIVEIIRESCEQLFDTYTYDDLLPL